MCNKDQLVGYLYGELSAAERITVEAHLSECAECRAEVGQLGQTRQYLAAWSPPEPQFNFQIVRMGRAATPMKRRLAFIPEWALAAAAALLVIAGAAAVANVEVRYGTDGTLTVRTGWLPEHSAADGTRPGSSQRPVPRQADASTTTSEALERQVVALVQRVRQLEALEADQPKAASGGGRQGISVPELRRILAESEARQRTEMAMYVAQIWKDFSAARASDLARVQQTLGQAQGLTNFHLKQQRDTIESLRYLHAVSSQQK